MTLLLSLMLAVTPQAAEAQPADQETNDAVEVASEEVAKVDDDDKIICRRTAIVGSKFKKKLCGTKKQWETLESNSRASASEMQRRGKGLDPNAN